jgi:tRNA nucleotidyltransferase (CCA-adding enzyme)
MKPDKTRIKLNTSIKKSYHLLKKSNLASAIVYDEDNNVAGTIEQQDINKALEHKLNQYPVKLITRYTEPDDPGKKKAALTQQDVQTLLNTIPEKNIQTLFDQCSEFASQTDLNLYLVGGIVRDLIRQKPSLDIDLTMENNAINFAEKLNAALNNITLKEKHDPFGTAKVIFTIQENPYEVDLASTRKEEYNYPGALPVITEFCCPLEEDLFRRDFTINAMAININKMNFGKLIDTCHGLQDLEIGILRIMHPLSFIDDPTRIVRGVKFAVRFGYTFSQATERLLLNCIESKLFDNYCTERLKQELKSTLNLNNIDTIAMINRYQITRLIHEKIPPLNIEDFKGLQSLIEHFKDKLNPDYIWLIYLSGLLKTLPENEIEVILNNLFMKNIEKQIIKDSIKLYRAAHIKKIPEKPSLIYQKYAGFFYESLIFSLFENITSANIESLEYYINTICETKISTGGNELIRMGFTPGPIFSEILNDLYLQKLDGRITSIEDEFDYIKKHYL